jgi:radical SAM superfamily enzyme YgiQ (UPF0313 family)
MGLPGEKPEDVNKTIDLMHDLRDFTSIIVPLYFVPIGHLQGQGFFRTKYNTPEHWQLLAISINHTLESSFKVLNGTPPQELKGLKLWVLKKIVRYMNKRISPYLKLMEEGINPIEHRKNKER